MVLIGPTTHDPSDREGECRTPLLESCRLTRARGRHVVEPFDRLLSHVGEPEPTPSAPERLPEGDVQETPSRARAGITRKAFWRPARGAATAMTQVAGERRHGHIHLGDFGALTDVPDPCSPQVPIPTGRRGAARTVRRETRKSALS